MKLIKFIPILFFVCFLIFIYFLLPVYINFKEVKESIPDREDAFREKQEYLSEIQNIYQRLNEGKESLEKIEGALPNKPSLSSLLNFFQEKSSESGLILKKFNQSQVSPESKERDKGVVNQKIKETKITITLQGGFSSLENFIQIIEKSSRIIKVEDINLSYTEEGFLELNLALVVFSY